MPKPVTRQPTPLSVRLSQAERDHLLARAGGHTLSAYVKAVLFDGSAPAPRANALAGANRTLLAHLLATLGASRIAPNLDRLAHEAEVGNLYADDETTARLREAADDVRLMHNALMRALGQREKSKSRHEISAAKEFGNVAEPEDVE